MRTSYSAIDRAERCLRLFAWGACDGVYEPQKKSGVDGDELHDVNEAYVRYGIDFPDTVMGRLARLGAELLPSRADQPHTEIKGEVKYAKHELTLRADVAWVGPCGPIVGDYKSVKHFGFVPTPAKLRMNLQAAINGLWAMTSMTPHAFDEATALWIFYRKPNPDKPGDQGEVKPVECTIERDNAHRVLRARGPILAQMEGLKATKTPALKVVGNEGACGDYGGCWYRHKCFPDQWELSLDGKKSVPLGTSEQELREVRRAPSSPQRTAALKFFDVLKLIADDQALTPEVLLHIVGLTSALLMHYGRISREEIACEIDLTSTEPAALEGLYLAIRAAGLTIPGAPDPEPPPDLDPDPVGDPPP